MDSYDSLFENQESQPVFSEQGFDKEAYKEHKQAERKELGEKADAMVESIVSDPNVFRQYLDTQHALGKSPVNTALIMAQYPKATMLKAYEQWMQTELPEDQRNNIRAVKKGMKGIRVFEKDGEYTRADGSVGTSYKVVKMFDILQTYGAPIDLPKQRQYNPRSLVKAITTQTSIPVRMSESIDQNTVAQLKDGAIYVAKGVNDGSLIFKRIAEEMAKADVSNEQLRGFIGQCSAYLVCKRYGIDAGAPESMPAALKDMDIAEKRNILSNIHDTAASMIERIDGNLFVQRHKEQQQSR